MEKEKNKSGVVGLLVLIIIILSVLCVLFATGAISWKKSEVTNNNQESENNKEETNSKTGVCDEELYNSDKLEITSYENKTEITRECCGATYGYNTTTIVTKEHDYNSTPTDEEKYTNDVSGTLFVLYNNNVYTTSKNETISKYCETSKANDPGNITCDYSKFNNNISNEFNIINIEYDIKAIGIYNNGGSGLPTPYAITTDGKVIKITMDSSNNYKTCGIMYDDSEHPIDRIFNMRFYHGDEYKILFKDGTLITRVIDRDNKIELEDTE